MYHTSAGCRCGCGARCRSSAGPSGTPVGACFLLLLAFGSGRVEGHVCIRDLVFLHLLPRARHRLWSSCPRLPYPITSEIWSPAGGFYADPKKWKRNTLITAA